MSEKKGEKKQEEQQQEVKKKNIKGILGIKVGMTRIFDEAGNAVPVTAIVAGPCKVIRVKEKDRDGYRAVQLGFGDKKKVNKPMSGYFKKYGVENNLKWIKEFRIDSDVKQDELGSEIRVEEIFEKGDVVKVRGISKGKGFTGVVKRWGFRGGPKTHGQSDRLRAPGSIGGSSYPSRVWKGLKMAGKEGNKKVTIKNLKVVDVLKDENLILIKGSVPGIKSSLLVIEKVK